MEDWQTFGHNQVKNILQKQIGTGKFPHAYLFSGPEGIGKKMLALEFAKKILNTENLSNHPDFQILDIEGEITIEPLLDFTSRLGFKPFLGQKKIAIINNVENFNSTSGNALLKILEEPSQSTIIILISGAKAVLPTIVSRCQVFNFNAFSKVLLQKFAEGAKISASEQSLDLAFGSTAKLKMMAEDKDFFEQQKKFVAGYNNLQKSSLGQKFISISELSELEAPDLEKNLLSWLFLQNQDLEKQPENFGKARAIMEALSGLARNQNKKLVLQGLMLKI
jgi:DNA polymerase-3 subunit delta'